jgi:hypothetical protein
LKKTVSAGCSLIYEKSKKWIDIFKEHFEYSFECPLIFPTGVPQTQSSEPLCDKPKVEEIVREQLKVEEPTEVKNKTLNQGYSTDEVVDFIMALPGQQMADILSKINGKLKAIYSQA